MPGSVLDMSAAPNHGRLQEGSNPQLLMQLTVAVIHNRPMRVDYPGRDNIDMSLYDTEGF